jgi:hypothetical protein
MLLEKKMKSRFTAGVAASVLVLGALSATGCTTSFAAVRSVDRHIGARMPADTAAPFVDLAAVVGNGVRVVNRNATIEHDGARLVLHLDEHADAGIAWLPIKEFEEGVIEADVRGRDLAQRSFVGLAFGGNGDGYEAVYLRPFLFRAADPVARASSLQYMAMPTYDWKRLRTEYPGRFERALPNPPAPTDWMHLRVTVDFAHVRAYIDGAPAPVLDVERIPANPRGRVGLWAGDGSDAAFANVRVIRTR